MMKPKKLIAAGLLAMGSLTAVGTAPAFALASGEVILPPNANPAVWAENHNATASPTANWTFLQTPTAEGLRWVASERHAAKA